VDRVIFVGDIVNSPLADGVGGRGWQLYAAVRGRGGFSATVGLALGDGVEVFRRGR
jgi:hypothetical protein